MIGCLNVFFGGALLLVGRRLFWLFVAVIGFAIGVQIAARMLHGSELLVILAGLGFGILFAVLAIFVETMAIGVAGFLGGGYIFLSIARAFGFDRTAFTWIIFIAGGIIGAALIAVLFDWALILLSSLAGASMVVEDIQFGRFAAALIFITALAIGVSIQASILHNEKRLERKHV